VDKGIDGIRHQRAPGLYLPSAARRIGKKIEQAAIPACLAFLVLLLAACTPTPIVLSPLPTPTHVPSDLHIAVDDVAFFPAPRLYGGDTITFDIVPGNTEAVEGQEEIVVRVERVTAGGREVLAEGTVGPLTFANTPRARLVWAWDASDLVATETLVVQLDPEDLIQEGDTNPDNNIVTTTIRLLPPDQRHPAEISASWITTTTECCLLHYLAGTASDRDIAYIVTTAEEATDYIEDQLNTRLPDRFETYLIGRIIGHGGYMLEALAVSYLDRHYAADDLEMVIRHEAVHLLDREMISENSPALLREGLAVWASGGHFKPEPIPQRAAAAVQLNRYIALEKLANDFYRQQHEIGYLEGAAFVAYLVDRYGWEEFISFYRSFDDSSHDTPLEALDAALLEHFEVRLQGAEAAFLAWLEKHPPTADPGA